MFSKFHFSRMFQRVTGLSPGRFLSALRLQQAKQLLVTTSFNVSDISLRVGYTSVGTFSTRFTRSVGLSPTIYRRRHGITPRSRPVGRTCRPASWPRCGDRPPARPGPAGEHLPRPVPRPPARGQTDRLRGDAGAGALSAGERATGDVAPARPFGARRHGQARQRRPAGVRGLPGPGHGQPRGDRRRRRRTAQAGPCPRPAGPDGSARRPHGRAGARQRLRRRLKPLPASAPPARRGFVCGAPDAPRTRRRARARVDTSP
ncbi:helix-turn-helix domain-containing protein [Catellatospora coxensis]